MSEMSRLYHVTASAGDPQKNIDFYAGVGSLAALAFVLIIGRAERFQCGKEIASYLGLVPSEDSSGDRRRLGHISKQGAAAFPAGGSGPSHSAQPPTVAQQVLPPSHAAGRKIAKVAMARKLAIQLFWMMRKGWDYEQVKRFGPHAGQPEIRRGVQ